MKRARGIRQRGLAVLGAMALVLLAACDGQIPGSIKAQTTDAASNPEFRLLGPVRKYDYPITPAIACARTQCILYWAEYPDDDSFAPTLIVLQRLAPEGQLLGKRIEIRRPRGYVGNLLVDYRAYDPSVALADDGSFAVSWREPHSNNDNIGQTLVQSYIQHFGPDDEVLHEAQAINLSRFPVKLAPLPDGGQVAVWRNGLYVAGDEIVACNFTREGLMGPRRVIATGLTPLSLVAQFRIPLPPPLDGLARSFRGVDHVAADAQGNHFIIWGQSDPDGYVLHGQRFAADGSALGAERVLTKPDEASYDDVFAMAPTGEFSLVLTYVEVLPYEERVYGLKVHRYDAQGEPLGETDLGLEIGAPALSYLPDGSQLAVWQDYPWYMYYVEDFVSGLHAIHIRPDGQLRHPVIEVNTAPLSSSNQPQGPRAALTGSGRALVIWTSYSESDDPRTQDPDHPTGIYARLLD